MLTQKTMLYNARMQLSQFEQAFKTIPGR